MAVRRRRLTDASVAKLAPADREYTVWDTRQAGLGVRVRPSGHRSYVYFRKGEDGARRITLGSALLTSVEQARAECLAIETGARREKAESGTVPAFADFVSGPAQACFERYKPRSRRAVILILDTHLLPAFGSLPMDRITRADVTRWFDEYSRTAPVAANHALNVFSRVMNHAVDCGHLRMNPARGVKRNHRPRLTRFLSREEVDRLHRALDRCAGARPSCARQADIIRLLLLTGCRKSEIMTLRWQDVEGDTINLVDAKTGPRRVLLNAAARAIIERQPRSGSTYVFPSPLHPERPLSHDLTLWRSLRKEAGIEDVRLHDLRHTFASHAVLQGVPLPVVSRLLGHKRPSMTLRYAHVGDREIEAAAERIGATIVRALDGGAANQGASTGTAYLTERAARR